jgi:LysR family transcriptional regulator, carnitine catabolism transcriptional activator
MNKVSLKHLQTFLTIIDAGNFRRAAEILHLSQPAVTAHVKLLEQAVGVSLLDRTTRRMRVTVAGERLHTMAEHTLADLNSVLTELRDEAALQRGRISISCVPTIAASVLPMTLRRFAEKYPRVAIKIFDVIAEQLFVLVGEGKVDFGIGPRPTGPLQFDFRALTSDPFVAVVPRGHPWASRKSISLADLVDAPFLTLLRGYSVRETLEAALKKHGLEITPRYEVRHHYTLGGMVEAGLGITALPSMAVSMLSRPLLRTVPIARPGAAREVGIIKLRGKNLSPAPHAFIEMFNEMVAEGF